LNVIITSILAKCLSMCSV